MLLAHITKIKEHWTIYKDPNNYLIKNLIIKDFNFTKRDTEYGMKENIGLIGRGNVTPNAKKATTGNPKMPSKMPQEMKPKILFKLNFDTGNGRISKIIVRDGDSLSK